MNKSDSKFFNRARQAANVSDYNKIHIGCIAVYQGNIIASGCNMNKTHPMQKFYNRYRLESDSLLPKIHAEINCLLAMRYMDIDFQKVKLYIYRIRNDRLYGMARPCPSCMQAIKDIGIRNIYYTTDEGFAHEILIKSDKKIC